MKAKIFDRDLLNHLNPLEITAYLRSSDWQMVSNLEDRYSIWRKLPDFELLVPSNKNFIDFTNRIYDILLVLEAAEERSQSEILTDLFTTGFDTLRVRLVEDSYSDGSMPLEDFSNVGHKLKDLVLASACSAVESKKVWFSKKPALATEYLDQVRVGQSERGSYIFTVFSSVKPILTNSQGVLDLEEPFPRLVYIKLATSLIKANQATEHAVISGSTEAFFQGVADGLNANLFDSLVGLLGKENSNREVEFSISWSKNRPMNMVVPKIVFSANKVPILIEASRLFKENQPIDDFTLLGFVTKLERKEYQEVGSVTVYGIIDEKTFQVSLYLEDVFYQAAVQAHKDKMPVKCVGILKRNGKNYVLSNVSIFEVVNKE